MTGFREISDKWQKKWEDSKVFEANPDSRKKFFMNFPYPYINSYLHLGHAFSVTRVDVFARYKRMQGFNVLFPQSWHCTGTPVWAAAQRVKEKEPKQLKILESLGFHGKELEKFSDVKHWIDIFVPAAKEDLKRLGASVDWRRSFITTDLNPRYDKFIRWQFRKLKEKGYVAKGTHPVIWCEKDQMPVGDHDRVEGEGETPQDFIWVKFRMKDSDLILMAGTTRPDALLGQSNMWIDPKGHYIIAEVDNERWVIGKEVFHKIENQYKKAKIIGKISPGELIGKWVKGPVVNRELLVLPADFIDSSVGSGVVYSALEDPVDLFELKKIQSSDDLIEKYGLDKAYVKKLKPFEIINVEGMGGNLGEDIGREFKIKSANDTEPLEQAKGELNRRVFRKGIMKENCGKFAGKTVPETQKILKKELVDGKDAVMFYEPSGKVVCRCLTECNVKTVSDQWFLKYSLPEWKEKTREALKNMDLYPELARAQFEYVLGWLNDWACTHHHGTGTKLPWDNEWVIESLSDSTIYMAFYTIAHLLNELPSEKIDDALFDFVFLGIGKGDKSLEKMKKEFEYWYPFDVRSSGKDLIQNHMAFCLFNHTAIFPKKHWPKSFSVNGWLLVDGEKMSKSKGNFFTIREILDKHSADVARTCLMLGGEGMNDPNFDMNNAKALDEKLLQWQTFAKEKYKKSKPVKSGELSLPDRIFSSSVNRLLKEGTESMEKMLFRTAFERLFFHMQKALRDYERKLEVNQDIINDFIELQTRIISPFCPFISEEMWSEIGRNGFVSLSEWPKYDESKIDEEAEAIAGYTENTRRDIIEILRLSKIQNPKSIHIFIAEKWKYKFLEKLKSEMKAKRDVKQIIKAMMSGELKQHGGEISKLIPRLVSDEAKIPSFMLSQETESAAIKNSISLLEKEFKCKIVVESAENTKEQKAKQAFPSKAAILIS